MKFTTSDGVEHELPPIDEARAGDVPGEITYNALLYPDSDEAQARLTIANVEAQQLDPALKKALLSLSTSAMIRTVYAWMGEASDGSSQSSPDTEEPSSTTGAPASDSPSVPLG